MKRARVQEFKNKQWKTLFTVDAETENDIVMFHQEVGMVVVYKDGNAFGAYKVYKIKDGQRVVLEE